MKIKTLQIKRGLRAALLVLLLNMVGMTICFADDFDFSAVCSTGQTLYYKITNNSTYEVQLTYPNSKSTTFTYSTLTILGHSFWSGYERPIGDVIIPDNVTYNGISYSVTSIRDHAFGDHRLSQTSGYSPLHHYDEGCPEITSIVIPSSITSIGDDAFAKCSGITMMTILAETPPVLGGSNVFYNVNKNIPVTVPCGSVESYQNTSVWNEFTNWQCVSGTGASTGAPTGAINGLFSIGENEVVYFSKGNLQYQATTNTWKFAENQYDHIGGANSNISSTYSGWIDLFGWGTGENPTNNYTNSSSYNDFSDWGVNPISNGGNTANQWNTLTDDEWQFLMFNRTTTSGIRFAKAKVNNVSGVIILPDDWNATYYTLSNVNTTSAAFATNTITSTSWANNFEEHGAVFLPTTGYRSGTSVYYVDIWGSYWSSTPDGSGDAYNLFFRDSELYTGSIYRYRGHSVRLVTAAQIAVSYTIEATPNPIGGGTVTGAGSYAQGQTCTLTATPNANYTFVNWMENGEIVSTNATYSFTVTGDKTFVANFTLQGDIPIGAISGLFSVGDSTQVYFSQGNLQYKASTNTWRFAENQWDYVGENNTNITIDYDEWIDLFSWGASGYDHGAVCYQPWVLEMGGQYNHAAYGCDTCSLSDYNGQADWGYNPILNGGNTEHMWHTLSRAEWRFLLETRNTVSGARYAKAIVNGVNGLVVLPDNWNTAIYQLNGINNQNIGYDANIISEQSWTGVLEFSGAVFLPAAGRFVGMNGLQDDGLSGWYWTATRYNSYMCRLVDFNDSIVRTNGGYYPHTRNSVRLVRNVAVVPSYSIEATPNPIEGGTVKWPGIYDEGQICTLIATPNADYTFVNWTKDGEVVSTNTTYSFTVTEAASFIANFELNSYEITATASPEAGGTITGAGTYNHFETCTLTAIANEGYAFVNWTKDGEVVSTNATYSFTVTETASFVANFELNSYEISVTASPTAGGIVTGAGTYNHGASCTLTATANEGYTFVNWTKDGEVVSTNATYSFIVTEEASFIANFELNSYEISVAASPTAGGIVTGAGTYNHGISCTLTATANEGYTFINWTKDGEVISTNATYSFTVTETASFVANFELNSYGITATASPEAGGTITGAGTYNHFETCTLTTTANEGYAFVNWTKDGEIVSTNATYSFTVTESATYVAHFQIQSYTVTISANPTTGGTVSGGGTYTYGQSCTVHATANTGYTFVNWTENGTQVSTNADYTFTVTGNKNLVAHFSASSYIITAMANPVEGGIVSGSGGYNYGDQCTLTATANEGYTFVNWTKDGEEVSTNTTYSFTVTETASFVANFELNSYEITATASPTAGGTVTGAGTYNYGTSCTLTATANEGYTFINWTKDGNVVSTNATYSFTVTEVASFIANFELNSYEISVTASPTASGIVTGAGTYNHGTSCTLTATANEGYTFVNWTKAGEEVSTNATYSFTVTESATYVAHFQLQSYTVTISANPTTGGTVVGGGTYTYGQNCTVHATANTGYTFVNWTENGTQVSTNVNYTFTVTGNRNLVAHFSTSSYIITATAYPAEGGTVTGSGGYNYGDHCTLTATANQGYTFVKWTKNGTQVSTNAYYTFTVTGSASYVAHFQAQSYTISVSADPTEGGTVNGGGTYTYGQTCTLNVEPNENYIFINWTENGNEVSTDANYTFTVSSNRTLVAHLQYVDVISETNAIEVAIYPNPTSYLLTVETSEPIDLFEIYSLTGALVYSQSDCVETIRIDVSQYAIGTYIVRLTTNDAVIVRKFVKKR